VMGDKAAARKAMLDVGVPIVPGTPGPVEDPEEAAAFATQIGFPVIIKATAGGGGKGMRVARDVDEFARSFQLARSEALSAFGNGDVYVEKYLVRPRHIEFQILGDTHGNVIHLGDGSYYFMEMNTRIQVEHPVTEMLTGVDLVKEQIRVAAGERLSILAMPALRGHVIECRVNAEDPARNFQPSPGRIDVFHPPGGPGVRLDTHVYAGYTVPPYYDSLIAKLIVQGRDRAEALIRMQMALESFIIEGPTTTIPFLARVMQNPRFMSGDVDTKFLEREGDLMKDPG